ncbi:MAG TPA: hypothetical protein VF104_10625 [Burkholderiales bacterium]
MTRGRLIAIVAGVAALAIVIMTGLFHEPLTPAQYDTIQMCAFSEEARLRVAANILDRRSTEGAGRGFPGPVRLQSRHQDYELTVSADGLINLRSGGTGVYLQLTPRLREGKVVWESRVSPDELSQYCRL